MTDETLPLQTWLDVDKLEVNSGQLKHRGLPENPRKIDKAKYELLKDDIKTYPQFLKYNMLKVFALDNGHYIVIGGNMRCQALKELGFKRVPVVVLDADTPVSDLKAYIILDNNSFGEYDWVKLADTTQWDVDELKSWGTELPDDWDTAAPDDEQTDNDGEYSRKVVSPVYEPSGVCPTFGEMYDTAKRDELLAEIEKANIDDVQVKEFLRQAACRHTVFNYEKIADYYAQAPAKVQDLMERSALVIIDFDKAIEYGFVQMTKDLANAYRTDYNITDEEPLTEQDICEDYDEE